MDAFGRLSTDELLGIGADWLDDGQTVDEVMDELRGAFDARHDDSVSPLKRLMAEVQTGMHGYSVGDLRAVARYLATASAARILALEAEIDRLRRLALQQQAATTGTLA